MAKSWPIWPELRRRKNVLLLGDSEGDPRMTDGMNHDTILKIGFLNYHEAKLLPTYEKLYDAIILGDGDFSFINQIFGLKFS